MSAAIGKAAKRTAPESLLADVGQALAQLGDERIASGQDALKAVDRVAQQHASVAIAPQPAVELGQPRSAAQRIRVTGSEHSFEPGPGLLAGQFRRRGLASRLEGGTEVAPRRERVQVIGPENALPV